MEPAGVRCAIGAASRSTAGRGGWLVGLALALLALGGCPDGTSCQGIGDPCQLLCCAGLSCADTGNGFFCTKSCSCRESGLCASTQFQEGCPQGSACYVAPEASGGNGRCVRLCDTSPCLPGEVLCSTTDGGAECHEIPPPDMLPPRG